MGHRPVLEDGGFGAYTFKTHKENFELSTALGAGLVGMGLAPEDADNNNIRLCSIFAGNCVEWYTTDIASMLYGITLAPLYNTLGPDAIKYIVN